MEITPNDLELLQKFRAHEDSMSEYEKKIGWTWFNVGVYPATINKFLVKGLVKVSFKSRSGTNYLLTDVGRATAEGGATELIPQQPTPVEELDLSTMFSDIVGYDDVKKLLRESLQLEKPIHALLHGPPSLAKTMFLWDIERAFGDQSLPMIGSATSHAGMWDLIAERKPKIVLIDELEKMNLTDTAGLLSLMEKGRIIRTKVGRKIDEQINCWVIATANRVGKLPAELLSRFAKFQLAEYNAVEFRKVVSSVLVSHEDTDVDSAEEIALRLLGKTHDVRDAVRVARLAKRVGVKEAVELLIR